MLAIALEKSKYEVESQRSQELCNSLNKMQQRALAAKDETNRTELAMRRLQTALQVANEAKWHTGKMLSTYLTNPLANLPSASNEV